MTNRSHLALLYIVIGSFLFLLFLFSPHLVKAEVIEEWQPTESLPTDLASHAGIGFGNKIFIFGGATNDDYSEVWQANQELNGHISSWLLVSNLPDTRYWGALSSKDGRVYFLGGTRFSGSGSENSTVYSSLVDDQGNYSTWETLNSMPEPRALGNSVVVNNRIYYAGGFSSAGRHSGIYYADILEDGTLGSWSTSSVPLPQILYGFSMLEHNGFIFVIGGNNVANLAQDKVYVNKVNEDGTLNAWTELNKFPVTNYRGHAIVVNDSIIVVGGEDGAGIFTDDVYYADILPGGIISEWRESTAKLPLPVSSGAIARVGDYLYITGGLTTGYNYLDSVYAAKISNDTTLPITLFKQSSDPWNDDLYDSANLWTSDPSFSRWGCAVTSAAMVFKYHGLNHIAIDREVDPGSLNEWLKFQPDGYTRNGSLNWLALTRLSRNISSLNDVDFDGLEFEKIFSADHELVKNAIDNENGPAPDILRVPNHFVVAKGYSDESIIINDPFYEREDLTEYGNTFQNISRFTPSNTDLSYIMLTINEGFDIKVYDENNSEVGVSFFEEPILDPSGEIQSNAPLLKTFYFQKPPNGIYRLEITGPQENYILDAFLYDEFGNIKTFSFEDFLTGFIDEYEIAFSKLQVSVGNIEKVEEAENVTYDSLLTDIYDLYKEKEIKFGVFVSLSAHLKTAQIIQKNNRLELKLLNTFKKSLTKFKKTKQITTIAEEELRRKVDILIENI